MDLQIPFNDLSRLDNELKKRISEKAAKLSVSGNYVLGPEVSALEFELAEYLNVPHCVGVGSGTDALIMALLALGVGPGDAVLTTANAGSYSMIAAKAIGAEPVFVDVSPESLQMTLHELENSVALGKAAGLKLKVVVVTHLFGQLNKEIRQIVALAKNEGILVIEDCAQALGARSSGHGAGSFGDLATFSFYPTKNLGASGDGGAVAGKDASVINTISKLRQYGWSSKYNIEIAGGRNSRMDEMQAAILRIKLPYLDTWNSTRREIYKSYKESANPGVTFFSYPDESYVAHLAPIAFSSLSQLELLDYFSRHDIRASVHFPVPDHKQKVPLAHKTMVPLPVTESACERIVSLPIFPEMTDFEISRICESVAKVGL